MESKRLKHFKKPKFIQLELTYTCNENCLFCYNPLREKKVDYKKIEALVDSVLGQSIQHVQLTGGEVSLLGTEFLNKLIDKLAKESMVSIVTNGIRTLEGLSKNLSMIFVSLHGREPEHEKLTRHPGGWKKTINSIEHYINEGFFVTSDTIMTRINYHEIIYIAEMARKLGMDQIMVNRFEDGGLGNQNSDLLRPSIEQFKEAITLIIKARKKYKIPIGFGTAIPFCLDERLIRENLAVACGAGLGFSAISPEGELRICNQSTRVFGNIFEDSIENIWNRNDLDEFRCMKWISGPCKNCPLLDKCHGGCFVDASQPGDYCIDYSVREQLNKNKLRLSFSPEKIGNTGDQGYSLSSYPPNYRIFQNGKDVKISGNLLNVGENEYPMDSSARKICRKIFDGEMVEADIINHFSDFAPETEIRKLLSRLVSLEALSINDFEERI